ncbi:MAG TPA: Smr/MutS family protein [Bacteroidales bacterium]|nr:Smr/MutS family protein [Bacteroidales bacterium]
MIFPNNFEAKIGFDHIRQLLEGYCVSEMGKAFAASIRFDVNFSRIEKKVAQTAEFLQLLNNENPFPSQNYFNLIPELQRIKLPGSYIIQEQLFDLKSSLETLNDVISYIQKLDNERFPLLKLLCESKQTDRSILNEIERIIDDKGNIKDRASDKLHEIRVKLVKLSGEIDRAVRQVMLQARKNGWINPNDDVTIRNGRLVIPVPAINKRKIRGFIQDESSTGQTVYIEPAEALEANNEILELQNAEKREIVRILTVFTEKIRDRADDLIEEFRFLGLIDFIRAKSILALQIKAIKPVMKDYPYIRWKRAIHPLLFIAHQKQKKHVEPLDIILNDENRILVISGPNAGGKSVCLKTVGLLQYMLQCGLPVPMEESSETGIFKDIFLDIGDEQSIEDDLSTYTSHLRNMKLLASKANKKSLFLIDEFGTGTEPQLGGAIAEAILEHLNHKEAFGVVTTHYGNLKQMAGKTSGLINGAMLFDTREMRPLFRLQMGNPGSSFAFEIAKKTGFPWYILRNAEKKIGKVQIKFDQQLQQLELEKKELLEQQKQVTLAENKFKELASKYQELLNKLTESKENILKEAKSEALRIIEESNRLVENTIREIKEAQADKEKTRFVREKMKTEASQIIHSIKSDEQDQIKTTREKRNPAISKKETNRIFVGNRVRIPPQQTVGEVIEIGTDEAVISFGSIIMRAPLQKIVNVGEEEFYQKVMIRRTSKNDIISDINTRMANFSLTLDLRGKRGEEAAAELNKYIDEAMLLNIKEVKIIHGKGDGILRKIVRENLKSISEVVHYEDEHIERGGSGATIVRLK